MSVVVELDDFSKLNFADFPAFHAQAESVGLTTMLQAIKICEDTMAKYGTSSQITLRLSPNDFEDAKLRLLAFFIVNLAYSQFETFRVQDGKWLFVERYRTYRRHYPQSTYFLWVHLYFSTLSRVR